jgi:hypothetical protein
LADLQTICAKYGLKTLFSPNDEIRKCMLDMKHGSTKNAIWDVINKKLCKFVTNFLFYYIYGLHMLTKDTKLET